MTPGDRIAGRFELVAEAASGGMGTVWRALDRLTKQTVALKVLRDVAAVSTTRFAREVEVLSQLSHPGIVRYVAHGQSGDVHYLVTEWVDGETLFDRLEREAPTMRETVLLGRKVADALAEAHRRGVIHRDVKPSNLMFEKGLVERTKVLDFGIARRAQEQVKLTQTGMMVGTMGYMSPEQARGTRSEPDGRSDVFSLGCVLYECLTGRRPFAGENMMAVRAKILISDPPRPRQLVADVPVALDELVSRMLAKDPAQRPADAASVASALAALSDLPDIRPPRVLPDEDAVTREASYKKLLEDTRSGVATQQRMVSVVLVSVAEEQYGDDATLEVADLERVIDGFGGRLHALADGSMIVVIEAGPAAAARCALELKRYVAGAQVLVATALATPSAVEQLVDAGARLLAESRLDLAIAGTAPPLWLDEATAGLLPGGFDIRRDASGRYALHGASS